MKVLQKRTFQCKHVKTIEIEKKKKNAAKLIFQICFHYLRQEAVNQFMEIRPCIHVVKVETLILQNVKQAVFRLFTSSDIDFKYYSYLRNMFINKQTSKSH